MSLVRGRNAKGVLGRVGWWTLFLVVLVYVGYSLQMAVSELLFLFGVGAELKHRATPVVFIVHALAGAMCLFVGPLQSFRWVRRLPGLRRGLGRTYVASVWLASVTAVVDANSFDVSAVSKAIFVATAVLWFATTTIGFLRALKRRFAERHEWMVRSYSLSLFVVSFSILVPALAATPLPPTVSYPLGLVLSTTLNLGVAELWIRRHRARGRQAAALGDMPPVAPLRSKFRRAISLPSGRYPFHPGS